jgi:hypothetical protein
MPKLLARCWSWSKGVQTCPAFFYLHPENVYATVQDKYLLE